MRKLSNKSKTKKKLVGKFTGRDVATNIMEGMQWESENFGYCTMNCCRGIDCPAIFHYDGGMRFICINRYCTHPERRWSIPASVIEKIADKWNEDKKIAISVV